MIERSVWPQGYLPCRQDSRESLLLQKRQEYWEMVPNYFEETTVRRTEYEEGIFKQVCCSSLSFRFLFFIFFSW